MEMEFEECPWHPWEEVVGICASCLRERLHSLKASNKNKSLRKHNVVYTSHSDSDSDSDSDSFLEFDEVRVYNFLPRMATTSIEKREREREIVARKKFMWFTKSKSQKKEKRTYFSLRSIFHRLRTRRKEESTCGISHEDSFISIKLDPSGSSARSSSAGEVKGILSKSCRHQDRGRSNPITVPVPVAVRWRTRMNALFHINSQPSNTSNQYPTLYTDRHCHRHRHRLTSTTTTINNNSNKKSWMRSLTSPKWRLH